MVLLLMSSLSQESLYPDSGVPLGYSINKSGIKAKKINLFDIVNDLVVNRTSLITSRLHYYCIGNDCSLVYALLSVISSNRLLNGIR